MATNGAEKQHQTVIGNKKNFWLHNAESGFDLTHPPTPDSKSISPRVSIQTKTSRIAIDPAKSALVVIDMQNFFLSAALGRAKGAGHKAVDQIVEHALPACRAAGIRVMWVNWGLTQEEIDLMPPSHLRAFGFDTSKPSGLGSDMGTVTDPESGEEINAGRFLMRDQWNTTLFPPFNREFDRGQELTPPDVWIHKNRMSGMWGSGTACEEFLEREGIRTLFFTGVNTDQCVAGTFTDCFNKGYDCVLLSDGCGTTSPAFAQQYLEFNAENVFGFVTSCKALADGVGEMER